MAQLTALSDPGIIKAANTCLKTVAPAINMLKNFAFNASEEFMSPGQIVRIPVASVGTLSAFGTDNDFEKQDGALTWEQVQLEDPIKATWKVEAADLVNMNVAGYLDTFAKASADKIQAYISNKLGQLFDKDDEGLSGQTVDTLPVVSALTLGDIAKLRGECDGRPTENVLILNTDYYSKVISLLNQNEVGIAEAITTGYVRAIMGFAAIVECPDLPDTTKGVILPKNNLVIVSKNFDVADKSCYSTYGYQADPETGFSITMMTHGSGATGSAFLNSVALFGFKLIKKSEIHVLV